MVKKSAPGQAADAAAQDAISGPDPHDKTLSRTQRKLASKSLQQLGQRLAALRDSERAALDLPADILEAVDDLNSMRSHIARKRQMLYLGKLLRRIDVGGIVHQLEHSEQQTRQQVASQHRAERWREHLLSHGDQALQSLLTHLLANTDNAPAPPVAEPQQWRALLRQAQQQLRAGKPPAASRKLYRMLYAADQAQPLPPVVD
ncbi:MAG: DUF615 domain-containing protein [Gammaproteobacteria bacterium]|nr:DUF615 domain-containing protein [Gammaproteobacteria bacterium]